jgi:uncharacterized delta-60 repeat protein
MSREALAGKIGGGTARYFLIALLLGAAAPATSSAGGELDPSFGTNGKVVTGVTDQRDYAETAAIDPAGRTVVGGNTTNATLSGSQPADGAAIVRYENDGDLDSSFSEDGKALPTDTEILRRLELVDLVIQPDGKVVVAGMLQKDFALARLDADGTPDGSFSGDGLVRLQPTRHAWPEALVETPSGKLLLVGDSWQGIVLVRFTESGRRDRSFSGDGVRIAKRLRQKLGYPVDATGQPDGRLLIAGADFNIARLKPSGRMDRSFSGNGLAGTLFPHGDDQDNAIALQDDGRIVLTGSLVKSDEGGDILTSFVAAARFRHGGSVDESFSRDGRKTFGFAGSYNDGNAVAELSGSRLAFGGTAQGSQFGVAVLEQNGAFATAFSGDGRTTVSFPHPPPDDYHGDAFGDFGSSVAVQPDGRFVVAGTQAQGYRYDGCLCEVLEGNFALARFAALP